ncbi:Protein kinase C-like 1, partial [Coemansia sp. RSA 2599]
MSPSAVVTEGIEFSDKISRNLSPSQLYEDALRSEKGTSISSAGALIARSGKKTGRSPRDKRVVEEASTVDD